MLPAPTTRTATGAVAPRGTCPTPRQPLAAADGLLVRVRIAEGEMPVAQAGALAAAVRRHGAGTIELTGRANVQIRGVRPATVDALARDLVAAGLLADDPAHEPRADVLLPPTAGTDPTELVDLRPVAAALRKHATTGPPTGPWHPKAGVVVDGGGAASLRGRPADVSLGAARRRDTGAVVVELALGAPLPTAPDTATTGDVVVVDVTDAADAAARVLTLAAAGTGTAGATGTAPGPRRVRDLVDALGVDQVVARVARDDLPVERLAPTTLDRPAPAAAPPLGVQRPGEGPGTAAVGAVPPLGRLDVAQLDALTTVVADHGGTTLRITPWRSILVPGVPAGQAPALVDALARRGWAVDPTDPARTVVACAGSTGCTAGLADSQAAGRRLVADRRARGPAHGRATVHVSGCAKRCAAGGGHDVTLVAVDGGAYETFVADPTAPGGERRQAGPRTPDDALVRAAAAPSPTPPSPETTGP